MATLQVKNIDDGLYEALRRRAEREHRSISQEVVSLIEASVTQPAGQDRVNATEAFLSLAGTWQDSRSAKAIAAQIREARRTGTRFRKDLF
jgi:plasmid stability protein